MPAIIGLPGTGKTGNFLDITRKLSYETQVIFVACEPFGYAERNIDPNLTDIEFTSSVFDKYCMHNGNRGVTIHANHPDFVFTPSSRSTYRQLIRALDGTLPAHLRNSFYTENLFNKLLTNSDFLRAIYEPETMPERGLYLNSTNNPFFNQTTNLQSGVGNVHETFTAFMDRETLFSSRCFCCHPQDCLGVLSSTVTPLGIQHSWKPHHTSIKTLLRAILMNAYRNEDFDFSVYPEIWAHEDCDLSLTFRGKPQYIHFEGSDLSPSNIYAGCTIVGPTVSSNERYHNETHNYTRTQQENGTITSQLQSTSVVNSKFMNHKLYAPLPMDRFSPVTFSEFVHARRIYLVDGLSSLMGYPSSGSMKGGMNRGPIDAAIFQAAVFDMLGASLINYTIPDFSVVPELIKMLQGLIINVRRGDRYANPVVSPLYVVIPRSPRIPQVVNNIYAALFYYLNPAWYEVNRPAFFSGNNAKNKLQQFMDMCILISSGELKNVPMAFDYTNEFFTLLDDESDLDVLLAREREI